MNKDRRKQIDAIIKRLESELAPLIDEIKRDIETVLDEEQKYFDNLPENLQDGEKGERAQFTIDALENAILDVEDIDLENLIWNLNEVQE